MANLIDPQKKMDGGNDDGKMERLVDAGYNIPRPSGIACNIQEQIFFQNRDDQDQGKHGIYNAKISQIDFPGLESPNAHNGKSRQADHDDQKIVSNLQMFHDYHLIISHFS